MSIVDWSMVGAIGEITGAAAVVVSLAYLAKQVSVSNRLARAEAWRSANGDLNALNASFGSDPVFRRGMDRVMEEAERDDLDVDERMAVSLYLISVANIYEQLFREVDEGVLADEALEFGAKDLFATPFFRSSWPRFKPHLGASFARHLELSFDLGTGEAE